MTCRDCEFYFMCRHRQEAGDATEFHDCTTRVQAQSARAWHMQGDNGGFWTEREKQLALWDSMEGEVRALCAACPGEDVDSPFAPPDGRLEPIIEKYPFPAAIVESLYIYHCGWPGRHGMRQPRE